MQLGSNRGSRLRRFPHFTSGNHYKSVFELMVPHHGAYEGPGSGEAPETSPLRYAREHVECPAVTAACRWLLNLGSVDISSHPDESTDEMEESEVPVGQLVEPGEEATEMLDLADEAFNEVAFPVQM